MHASTIKYLIVTAALFIIISSKVVYNVTSKITEAVVGQKTINYGCPTRFGIVLHGIVFSLLHLLSHKFV
jgi:hypothetical protein